MIKSAANQLPPGKYKFTILPLFLFTAWSFSSVGAQTPLNTDEQIHRISFSGAFEDFIIPNDSSITQIIFTAKGGDGGTARVERESCTSPGGEGAMVSATIDVGTEPDQIPLGTKIRFIAGGKGTDGFTRSDFLGTGLSYGGGGGGTAILYETPDTTVWKMLAIAGGGGGAYVGRVVGICVNNGEPASGQGGQDYIEAGDGKGGLFKGDGGTFGDGGGGNEFAGGGGGFLTEGRGVTCIEIAIPPTTYQAGAGQKGYPEGGLGGMQDDCIGIARINPGGFGFGGGGAGWGSGGGGGGYSGGGAGGTTGGGGGGGSLALPIASSRTLAAGGSTKTPTDGYIEYQIIRKRAETPVAQCKDADVTLSETGLIKLDAMLLDSASFDPSGSMLTFSLSQDTFTCDNLGEQIITLKVTNESGLSAQCNAKVNVVDEQAPSVSCPADVEIDNDPGECGALVDFANQTSAEDNCEVTLDFSHLPGTFFEAGETSVTVMASDRSGNTAECSFLILVQDNEAPGIACPADLSFDCSQLEELDALAGIAMAIDNCRDVTTTFEEIRTPLSCAGEDSFSRIWTAVDTEGNTSSCTQELTRIPDQDAPECPDCPTDIAVSCDSVPELPTELNIIDNCDPQPSFTVSEEIEQRAPGNCGFDAYTLVRTFLIQDACGNMLSHVQRITVADQEAPECLNCPPDISVSCDSVPPLFMDLEIRDNCDPSAFFTVRERVEENAGDDCSPFNYVLLRTYNIQDACGNLQEYTQRIEVGDHTAPVFDCPPSLEISCDLPLAPSTTGFPLAVDNCDPAPDLTFTDVLPNGDCEGDCTILRTWTATDACGNSSECVQTILQNDRTIIETALSADLDLDGISDPIVLGFSNHSLTIGIDVLDCVLQWLPHAGETANHMPRGNYSANPEDCLPGLSPLTEDGRIENRLLGEMLLLAINLRLHPELGELSIYDFDCNYSVFVSQAMRRNSSVNRLFDLGNLTLANLYGPFYGPVASALECINAQFQLCESPTGENTALKATPEDEFQFSQTKANTIAETRLNLYPNPAREELFINQPALSGKNAILRIFNLQGRSVFEKHIEEWPSTPLRISLDQTWEGMYMTSIFVLGEVVQTGAFVIEK